MLLTLELRCDGHGTSCFCSDLCFQWPIIIHSVLKKNQRGLGERMLRALDCKVSNGGTKEVRQMHFLKFQVESPNAEDLAGNRAKTELQEESPNLKNSTGNRANIELQKESPNLENVARNRAKTELHVAAQGSRETNFLKRANKS
jgi:hypothetical protein